MGSDGFGTLTAGIMTRNSDRVQAVIGRNGSAPQRQVETPPVPARPQMKSGVKFNSNMQSQGHMQSHGKLQSHGPATSAQPRQLKPTSRRGASGTTLKIHQPPTGDMSEVTVSMWGAAAEAPEGAQDKPSKDGQRPTSVTYERCSLDEHEERKALNVPDTPMWIDTPSFSGPDRRHETVSPEVERRRSVPPRLKVGVRLEQERYLRLKLATQESGRTQQDLITSALDHYFDEIGIDRFVRVAMGFGGVQPSGNKVEPAKDPAQER